MPEEPNTTSTPPTTPTPPATGGTFTQEDMNALAAKVRDEGRASERKSLLAELGIETVEQAKEVFSKVKAQEDAAKTEAQRLSEELARTKAEAESSKAEALALRVTSSLENSLRDAKINPARISQAIRLAELDAVKVEGGAVVGLEDVVTKLKAVSPEWFTGAQGAPDASGSSSGGTDYRSASPAEVSQALRKYNIR